MSPGVSGTPIRRGPFFARVPAGFGTLLLLLGAPSGALAQVLFDLPSGTDAVVVRYTERLGELEDPDPGPSLVVYVDGKVVVHQPRYMRAAGDYSLRLDQANLRGLVSTLVAANLVEFDGERARQRRREAAQSAGLLNELDASTIQIDLNLASYRPPGPGAVARSNVVKRVSWYGLRRDAELLPGVPEIRNLDTCRRALEALMLHPDLERLR